MAIRLTLTPSFRPLFEIENPILEPIKHIDTLGKDRYINSTSARGMGLGLWICRQIIELHDASILLSQNQNSFKVALKF